MEARGIAKPELVSDCVEELVLGMSPKTSRRTVNLDQVAEMAERACELFDRYRISVSPQSDGIDIELWDGWSHHRECILESGLSAREAYDALAFGALMVNAFDVDRHHSDKIIKSYTEDGCAPER